MKNRLFTGSGVALITPFKKDLSVDFEALGALIEAQIAGGADALITCGTTGEPSTLSADEWDAVVSFTVIKEKASDSYPEKFLKIGIEYGNEAEALKRRHCFIQGLLEYTFVISEPRELSVLCESFFVKHNSDSSSLRDYLLDGLPFTSGRSRLMRF